MFGTSPKRGQPKTEHWCSRPVFEDAFPGVEELTDERKVESSLGCYSWMMAISRLR